MPPHVQTAKQLIAPAKGLLAPDTSLSTIKLRFDPLGIAFTAALRRGYRDMLFSTAGIAQHISGVLMFEETLGQATACGELFPKHLARSGIIPGIKVDLGTVPLNSHSAETITEGLDGLADRLNLYRQKGACFAKWRAVIHIEGNRLPTPYALAANAWARARYARLYQDSGLTPIVEPEVLMDGDQGIVRSAEVTRTTLQAVFAALHEAEVDLDGMPLKPNLVSAGAASKHTANDNEVAASAPLAALQKQFGFTPEAVLAQARQQARRAA